MRRVTILEKEAVKLIKAEQEREDRHFSAEKVSEDANSETNEVILPYPPIKLEANINTPKYTKSNGEDFFVETRFIAVDDDSQPKNSRHHRYENSAEFTPSSLLNLPLGGGTFENQLQQ